MVAPTGRHPATRNGLVYVDLREVPAVTRKPGMFVRGEFSHRSSTRASRCRRPPCCCAMASTRWCCERRRRRARATAPRCGRRQRLQGDRIESHSSGLPADGAGGCLRWRASWPTATWSRWWRSERRARSRPRRTRRPERFFLVDTESRFRRSCSSCILTVAGLIGVPGHEDPAVPGRRLAHGVGAGRRCPAHRAGADRKRGRPQDRERYRHCAGRQAPLHHAAATALAIGQRRVPPREAHAGGCWTTCATAVSRVRSDLPAELRDPIVTKMDLASAADPHLHRGLGAHGRRRRCRGSSTTRLTKRMLAVQAEWARSAASAASRAKCAWNWTRRA
jgi:hypothetical protein